MVKGQDTGSGVNKVETTAGVWQQSVFTCSAADSFQHTTKSKIQTVVYDILPSGGRCRKAVFGVCTKSSRSRIDKRTARATGNTRYRYSKNARLDHKMADNCVSLARTNTLSSTITKLIKTSKTSNKCYSYHLLNRINKMYTHDLFYLHKEWEAWLGPVYIQIRTTKSQLTQCTKYKCH